MLTHECLLFRTILQTREGAGRILRSPPSCFFPSPSILESQLETLVLQNLVSEGGDRHCSTSSTVFFQVSEACAWILSGWQMSSICRGIPCMCWQVCLHNYWLKNQLVYSSWHDNMGTAPACTLHSYHCSLEDPTCWLLQGFRVWPPLESAGTLHKERRCDKVLTV